MATIDIRDVTDAEIDVIKFSDVKGNEDVCFLKKNTFVCENVEVLEEVCKAVNYLSQQETT